MVPAILNESGEELEGESEGYLVRRDSSGWDAASVLMAAPVTGVQAAVARCDEDRLREPRTLREHLLQEVSRLLRNGRR